MLLFLIAREAKMSLVYEQGDYLMEKYLWPFGGCPNNSSTNYYNIIVPLGDESDKQRGYESDKTCTHPDATRQGPDRGKVGGQHMKVACTGIKSCLELYLPSLMQTYGPVFSPYYKTSTVSKKKGGSKK